MLMVSFVVVEPAAPGTCRLRLGGRLWEESGREPPVTFPDGEVTVQVTAGKPAPDDGTGPQVSEVSNSPNPFNGATVIRYRVTQTQRAKVAVYDLLGQRVRQLSDQVEDPGWKQVPWDGLDGNGARVTSGVYFCLVEQGGLHQVHPMLLLR